MSKKNANRSLIAEFYFNRPSSRKGSQVSKIVIEMEKLWQNNIYVVTIDDLIDIVVKNHPEVRRGRIPEFVNWTNKEGYIIYKDGKITILPTSTELDETILSKSKEKKIERNSIDEYLPTKNDCERIISKISELTTGTEINVEKFLAELEKDLKEKGEKLKGNWKIITKENLKLWFG